VDRSESRFQREHKYNIEIEKHTQGNQVLKRQILERNVVSEVLGVLLFMDVFWNRFA